MLWLLAPSCLTNACFPGYAAGYVASSFYLGRLLSSYVWGFASDRLGRKHVMVISLVSIVIGSIFFGVSEGLVWAISVR